MTIHLFNTLSGRIEPLVPMDGATLRMYACGPTVYDYGHIGNFRTFLHVDVLRRALELSGTPVRHVMNITDVDDKIIRNATAAGLHIADYTRRFEEAFFEDLEALSVERPTVVPRATEHIPEMVHLVERLAEEKLAYQTEDGSWYFRIAGFPEYGRLSKKDFAGINSGARVDVDEYDKDSARDFALWKAPKPGEHRWDSAIGAGRPGWHLECSAMAIKYLGDSFDLHAGGEDLMFPHHENEIAQSECATHQTFARHWFHVRFLLVEGRKMSKSEGNFYTLRDLLLKGYKASAIRSLLISVPYGQQLNFTFEGLAAETAALERLRTFQRRLLEASFETGAPGASMLTDQELLEQTARARQAFDAALANDLNTAEAKAAIFDLVRAANIALDQRAVGLRVLSPENRDALLAVLARFDRVFAVLSTDDVAVTDAALDWAECAGRLDEVPAELLAQRALSDIQIEALIEERKTARHNRNFARGDAIRDELLHKGVVIEDSKEGVRWRRR
ncbi:cysteine--tRNA ligase [Acidipila sp. EB88]|uniref:cysteine--tRNA ligase n=1 Tax=Acidipila sp. EB88 TaxID=2305226 RepID=UPI000F5DB738|nr:cysteine--tRNA ligase [Acidipila sp. EB88]RRA47711.1 cysteine--tRNA ligase [Acidipila sp. EB88]